MSEVRPRIVGSETEFAIATRNADLSYHRPFDPHYGFVDTNLPPGLKIAGSFLSNGAKFYKDVNLIEYATPEEISFRETVRREFAGERIVIDALAKCIDDHQSIVSGYIRKRVIGDEKGSSGYHINLSADRSSIVEMDDESMHLLALHLATSQPLIGAGAIYKTANDNSYYSYSQKILDLRTDYDLSTNVAARKPLINLRDKPYSSHEEFRRIHITSVDPHISPWAAQMTLGTCSLVLRAIEQGRQADVRVVTNGFNTIVELARRAATDMSGNQRVILEGSTGKSISVDDIRERIIEIVEQTEHTPEEAHILEEWKKAHNDFATDPSLLADRSDAIARLEMIRKWNRAKGNDPDDMTTNIARAADSVYDRIFEYGTKLAPDTLSVQEARERSYPDKLRRGAMQAYNPSEAEIIDAYYNPPTTTRAFGRGRDIAAGDVHGTTMWTKYYYKQQPIKTEDPYEPDVRNNPAKVK